MYCDGRLKGPVSAETLSCKHLPGVAADINLLLQLFIES